MFNSLLFGHLEEQARARRKNNPWILQPSDNTDDMEGGEGGYGIDPSTGTKFDRHGLPDPSLLEKER